MPNSTTSPLHRRGFLAGTGAGLLAAATGFPLRGAAANREFRLTAGPATARLVPPGDAAALPAAEHHEFARAAHAPFLSHPEQFVARLESWRAGL